MRDPGQSCQKGMPESDLFRHFLVGSGETPHPVVLFSIPGKPECVFSREKTLLRGSVRSDEWGRLNHAEDHGKDGKVTEKVTFFTFRKTGL